jgi:hypothetical protein
LSFKKINGGLVRLLFIINKAVLYLTFHRVFYHCTFAFDLGTLFMYCILKTIRNVSLSTEVSFVWHVALPSHGVFLEDSFDMRKWKRTRDSYQHIIMANRDCWLDRDVGSSLPDWLIQLSWSTSHVECHPENSIWSYYSCLNTLTVFDYVVSLLELKQDVAFLFYC